MMYHVITYYWLYDFSYYEGQTYWAVITSTLSAACLMYWHFQGGWKSALLEWNHTRTFTCSPFFVGFALCIPRKTTHRLFKWCHWLKAVFSKVYWLHILGYFKFYLFGEWKWLRVTQQSSNGLHWISLSYQTLVCHWFFGKYMFICRHVKHSRFKNK